MCELTKNVRWSKVIISGLIYIFISAVIRRIEVIFAADYYKNPAYFGLWSKLMPKAQALSPKYLLLSVLFSLIAGLTYALIYEVLREKLENNFWMGVLSYTLAITWLSFVFFTLPVYYLFNAPLGLLIVWQAASVVIYFLSAIAFAKILNQEQPSNKQTTV